MPAMPLPFRPNCQPTSLGPLPHTSAEAAWNTVLRHTPALPALPLLAGAAESPMALGYEAFPGVQQRATQVEVDRATALGALDQLYAAYLRGSGTGQALTLQALPRAQAPDQTPYRRARMLFGLVPGPLSLALTLVDTQDEPLGDSVELIDALAKHLFLRRAWLQRALGRLGRPTAIWVYEPHWALLGSPFNPQPAEVWLDAASQTLQDAGPRALWIADLATPEALLLLPLDLIGAPLPAPAQAPALAPLVRQLLERQVAIGWGIVPASLEGLRQTSAGRLAARFDAWVRALDEAGIAAHALLGASLIMPEDTLDHLPPDAAERALALTAELAAIIRHSYGVE